MRRSQTAVYPVAFFLMLLPARTPIRVAGIVAGLGVGVAVALSRVALGRSFAIRSDYRLCGRRIGRAAFHPRCRGARSPGRLSAMTVVLSLGTLTVALHNAQVPTQRWVTQIALTRFRPRAAVYPGAAGKPVTIIVRMSRRFRGHTTPPSPPRAPERQRQPHPRHDGR